jgi:hypothetical protein
LTPADPKSMVASALSPAPEVATTVPRPNFWCVTRSPAANDTTGPVPTIRSPRRSAALLLLGDDPNPPDSGLRPTGSSRRQSMTSEGISSRKREGGLNAGAPPGRAHDRPCDVEALPGPRDPDVGEAALLLELARAPERAHVREDAILHPGEEHHGELEPLRRVQRHERDDAAIGIRDLVGVRDERHPLEEVGERPLGILGGELLSDRLELGEVLDPGLVLRVGRGLELGEVAALLEHGLEDRRGVGSGLDDGAQVAHERDEPLDARQRARGDAGGLVGTLQRGGETDALALAERLDHRLGAVADPALGGVEDPPQRHLVGGVRDRAQVCDGVAHLAALVEPRATDDLVRAGRPG